MFRKILVPFLFFLGGLTTLSWLNLWQLDLSIALGVSARGTALMITVIMAAITLGALWSGRRLESKPPKNPWFFYGVLTVIMGLLAWLPLILTSVIKSGDAAIYQAAPFLNTLFSALMLAVVVGLPSFAVGAVFTLMGVLAKNTGFRLSRLLAAKIFGAAVGTLCVAFVFMPGFGRIQSGIILFGIQLGILGLTWFLGKNAGATKPKSKGDSKKQRREISIISPRVAVWFAALAGFATFALQISWFRLLRSAWLNTVDSTSLMIFVFLVALGVGVWLSSRLRNLGLALSVLLALSAMAIWIGTPFVERFDLWGSAGGSYFGRVLMKLLIALLFMGPGVAVLGMALPWLLDETKSPREWAKIFGIHTIGALIGSLSAGWLLMEKLGPVKTSWIAGIVIVIVAIPQIRAWRGRFELLVPSLMILIVAWWADSGIGESRTQGPTKTLRDPHRVITHKQAPTSTTSVVKTKDGMNVLYIDGYAAGGEFGVNSNYLDAMGRLPMLLHTDPRDALVIGFGAGQTARAILDERPERLTVIDSNAAVFDAAEHFKTNRDVLKSDHVRYRTTDSRNWLRRTSEAYDVVTVVPMPPFIARTNSNYSVEFYEELANCMKDDGFVAQWFPIHLMTPSHSKAIAAAFSQVFPNAILWFDPSNVDMNDIPQQGILLGRKGDTEWELFPGFSRNAEGERPLDFDTVNGNVFLTFEEFAAYIDGVEPVTDDNQILSYDYESLHRQDLSKRLFSGENMVEFFKLKKQFKESQSE